MADKLLMTRTPRDMRESFLDSLQEASKINREMFNIMDWKIEDSVERVALTESEIEGQICL